MKRNSRSRKSKVVKVEAGTFDELIQSLCSDVKGDRKMSDMTTPGTTTLKEESI